MRTIKKRGFTLLEMIIALAIAGITGSFAVHFLWPQLSAYENFSKKVDGKYLCSTLFHILEPELRFGRDFCVLSDGTLNYVIVESDGSENTYNCMTLYDAASESFIPENCVIRVSYAAYSAKGLITMVMEVCQYMDADGMQVPVYEQEVTLRSLYSGSF